MWIPADRFLAVIDASQGVRFDESAQRRICGLRNGEYQFIHLETVDRIFIRHDLEYWWHVPKDEGGLADIYVDGTQYGSPHRPDDDEIRRAKDRIRYARKRERRLIDPAYRERERARWRANKARLRRAA